jgi:ligand-binding SRPBCC domain-containing protein
MLEINLLGIRQQWHSEITTRYEGEQIFWFVDEGRKLPFFLTHWVHIHRVVGLPDGTSELQEDVRYDTPWWVPGFAVRLALLQMFTARRPIYRRWFERA